MDQFKAVHQVGHRQGRHDEAPDQVGGNDDVLDVMAIQGGPGNHAQEHGGEDGTEQHEAHLSRRARGFQHQKRHRQHMEFVPDL